MSTDCLSTLTGRRATSYLYEGIFFTVAVTIGYELDHGLLEPWLSKEGFLKFRNCQMTGEGPWDITGHIADWAGQK